MATVTDVGEMDTPIADRIVTGTEADFDGSASGVAVICTVAGDGGVEGAVYTPLEETAPHAVPVQPVPETLQRIVSLGFEPATGVSIATKFAASPVLTDAGPVRVKENVLVMVIVPIPLFDGSATLMAVRVTLGGVFRI